MSETSRHQFRIKH